MSSVKWRPFCFGLNVLITVYEAAWYETLYSKSVECLFTGFSMIKEMQTGSGVSQYVDNVNGDNDAALG